MDPSVELAFDVILRKLDELKAQMQRCCAMPEERGAAVKPHIGGPEQSGVTLLVKADNWGGEFDEIPALDTTSFDSSSTPSEKEEHTVDAHVVADNWGGEFAEQLTLDAAATNDVEPETNPHQIQELEELQDADITAFEMVLSNRDADVVFTRRATSFQICISEMEPERLLDFHPIQYTFFAKSEYIPASNLEMEVVEVDEKVPPSTGSEELKAVVAQSNADQLLTERFCVSTLDRDSFAHGFLSVPRLPRRAPLLRPRFRRLRRAPLLRRLWRLPPRPPQPRRRRRAPLRPPWRCRPCSPPLHGPRPAPPRRRERQWRRTPPRWPRLRRPRRAPPHRRGRPTWLPNRRCRPRLRARARPRARPPEQAPRYHIRRRRLRLHFPDTRLLPSTSTNAGLPGLLSASAPRRTSPARCSTLGRSHDAHDVVATGGKPSVNKFSINISNVVPAVALTRFTWLVCPNADAIEPFATDAAQLAALGDLKSFSLSDLAELVDVFTGGKPNVHHYCIDVTNAVPFGAVARFTGPVRLDSARVVRADELSITEGYLLQFNADHLLNERCYASAHVCKSLVLAERFLDAAAVGKSEPCSRQAVMSARHVAAGLWWVRGDAAASFPTTKYIGRRLPIVLCLVIFFAAPNSYEEFFSTGTQLVFDKLPRRPSVQFLVGKSIQSYFLPPTCCRWDVVLYWKHRQWSPPTELRLVNCEAVLRSFLWPFSAPVVRGLTYLSRWLMVFFQLVSFDAGLCPLPWPSFNMIERSSILCPLGQLWKPPWYVSIQQTVSHCSVEAADFSELDNGRAANPRASVAGVYGGDNSHIQIILPAYIHQGLFLVDDVHVLMPVTSAESGAKICTSPEVVWLANWQCSRLLCKPPWELSALLEIMNAGLDDVGGNDADEYFEHAAEDAILAEPLAWLAWKSSRSSRVMKGMQVCIVKNMVQEVHQLAIKIMITAAA